MSKPAARIGDMHVCPIVTPGTPPIPHVGGPITGPGVPTVLIGGMPAAVMGDMCVCTGPPDTIAMGSTGVFIGGKPAARMGDSNAHGGTIVIGCPTVLIGETSGGGGGGSASLKAVLSKVKKFKGGEAVAKAVKQNLTLQKAAAEGSPFCKICTQESNEVENSSTDNSNETEREKNPRITNLVWMKGDQIITSSKAGKDVKIRVQVMDMDDGQELTFSISDPNVIGDDVDPIELKGTVKDGYVEVDWEVVDPYLEDEEEL